MDRLKKVFDNLDLEVAANERSDGSSTGGRELQDMLPSPRRRRASSADHYCIEGRLKGGSFCDSFDDDDIDDNNNKSNMTKHEFPRKRHSTGDCLNLLRHQTSASSFGLDFATSSSPLSEIKKLDSQNSFPDFVGALGARHLALQAAKDKQRQVDQLCGSDHIDPDEERLHCSDELRGSFAAAQPKEARLRRSKHLTKFEKNRSDDHLDGSAHSDRSGYDSSSSFGSVGDLILKALNAAGHDLESETAVTSNTSSNARAGPRKTTKAAHRARRQYRASCTEGMIQPKTGFGQHLPCIAPTPQGFGGRRGLDFCSEDEIIYRRRSSTSYASRRRSSRSALSNRDNDDSDDDDDCDDYNDAKPKAKTTNKSSSPSKPKSKPKSKISPKALSQRMSQRRASRSSKVDKDTISPTASNDSSGRGSGSCRSDYLSRRISAAEQSCDSFKSLASIEAATKKNRFAPI